MKLSLIGCSFVVVLASVTGCALPANDEFAQSSDSALRLAPRTDAQIRADLEAKFAGLDYMSESDYPFQVVNQPIGAGERITTAFVKRHFSAVAGTGDELGHTPLDAMTAEIVDFDAWFSSFAVQPDTEADLVPYFQQMSALRDALKKDIKDLRVYRFGRKMRFGGGVDGQVNVFIVGRSPTNTMIGVFTKSVET